MIEPLEQRPPFIVRFALIIALCSILWGGLLGALWGWLAS